MLQKLGRLNPCPLWSLSTVAGWEDGASRCPGGHWECQSMANADKSARVSSAMALEVQGSPKAGSHRGQSQSLLASVYQYRRLGNHIWEKWQFGHVLNWQGASLKVPIFLLFQLAVAVLTNQHHLGVSSLAYKDLFWDLDSIWVAWWQIH